MKVEKRVEVAVLLVSLVLMLGFSKSAEAYCGYRYHNHNRGLLNVSLNLVTPRVPQYYNSYYYQDYYQRERELAIREELIEEQMRAISYQQAMRPQPYPYRQYSNYYYGY